MKDTIQEPDLGTLTWDDRLDWWEGSILLSSNVPFRLFILAREGLTTNRAITADARAAARRIRDLEAACRHYAADQLFDVYEEEWSEGSAVSRADFIGRLTPDTVEIHETGYSEVHFGDGDLFSGHGVGVRIRPDGSFQEAVVEG